MDWLRAFTEFLDNKSVAAFAGAFFAFLLVIVNDWRRERRKVKNIRGEIEMNEGIAQKKLETVRRNRSAMRDHNKVMPAPILKFNTTLIRALATDALSHLTIDQRRALEALCYTMEATDDVLADAYSLAKEFSKPSEPSVRMANAERLLIEFGDAIVNLKRLIEMCSNYVAGEFAIITTKQYDRLEYEEK